MKQNRAGCMGRPYARSEEVAHTDASEYEGCHSPPVAHPKKRSLDRLNPHSLPAFG